MTIIVISRIGRKPTCQDESWNGDISLACARCLGSRPERDMKRYFGSMLNRYVASDNFIHEIWFGSVLLDASSKLILGINNIFGFPVCQIEVKYCFTVCVKCTCKLKPNKSPHYCNHFKNGTAMFTSKGPWLKTKNLINDPLFVVYIVVVRCVNVKKDESSKMFRVVQLKFWKGLKRWKITFLDQKRHFWAF